MKLTEWAVGLLTLIVGAAIIYSIAIHRWGDLFLYSLIFAGILAKLMAVVVVQDFMKISVEGRNFALMHYPMLSWPKKSSGGYQLHGHFHARMEYNEKNRAEGIRRYDVGVDANNFFPVSVKQVIDFFGEQVNIDDHNIV